jgi:8-oxo-dGTP pyrophosphatase MutT (NUDIX family)
MYEVFFNECQLSLMTEINISSKDNINQVIGIEEVADFLALLSAIENNHFVSTNRFTCLVSPGLLKTLPENFTQIPAAGGLVTDLHDRFLFIRRFGRWDLPKGAIEKNESAVQAAIREVEEECGLDELEIRKELPATFHLYRSRHIRSENNWVLKKTSWFEMFHHGNGNIVPQIEEDIEAVRWFDRTELNEVFDSTYANLKKMLHTYFG